MQSLCKTVWKFLKKLEIELPYDPAIPPLGIYLDKRKKERKKVKSLSRVQLFATPWTVAYHAPPSTGFSRQEYWSGLPLPVTQNIHVHDSTIYNSQDTEATTMSINRRMDKDVVRILLFSHQVVSSSFNLMGCSTPGSSVLHYLPEIAQIHVH